MVRNTIPEHRDFYSEDNNNFNVKMNNVNHLKRSLTLNLNTDENSGRNKFCPTVPGSAELSTPDVKKFSMTPGEVERFILSHPAPILQTPTPSTTQLLFPKSVPDDQELYSQEFVDALSEFPNNDSSRGMQVQLPKSSSSSNSSINNFMNIDNQYPPLSTGYSIAMSPSDSIIVKEEPQTVPNLSTPPLSPINMESQERIKLERKRQRNRVAASKCRKRKLEKIAKLEEKVKLLKGENSELGQIVIRLKEEVCNLKEKVLKHVNNGCKIVVSPSF